MDIMRHLECFLAVGEERHFGRAAERLGMEQPPLSQRIRRMEKELGAQLFDRGGGRVSLTTAGHVLMNEAPKLLKNYRRMRTLVSRAAASTDGEPPRPWTQIHLSGSSSHIRTAARLIARSTSRNRVWGAWTKTAMAWRRPSGHSHTATSFTQPGRNPVLP